MAVNNGAPFVAEFQRIPENVMVHWNCFPLFCAAGMFIRNGLKVETMTYALGMLGMRFGTW
jgi:hypothetical protein